MNNSPKATPPPSPVGQDLPYKSTKVFDQDTLPAKLRSAHSTGASVWGIIRVLEGELRYVIEESGLETILTPDKPGLVLPEQLHHVEPLGPMRMQVEFYDHQLRSER